LDHRRHHRRPRSEIITSLQEAAWFGLPPFTHPTFAIGPVLLMVPVVLILIAENTDT